MNPEHTCDIWLSLWLISEESTLKYRTSLFPHWRRTRLSECILWATSQECPTTEAVRVLQCATNSTVLSAFIKSHPLKHVHTLLLHRKITCCVRARSTYRLCHNSPWWPLQWKNWYINCRATLFVQKQCSGQQVNTNTFLLIKTKALVQVTTSAAEVTYWKSKYLVLNPRTHHTEAFVHALPYLWKIMPALAKPTARSTAGLHPEKGKVFFYH